MPAVRYLDKGGPPSSPPMNFLLVSRITKQQREHTRKRKTEKPRGPAGTMY